MRQINLSMDCKWFIKQNERINLGYQGETDIIIHIDTPFLIDPSYNYYLDVAEDTVPLYGWNREATGILTANLTGTVLGKAGTKAIQVRASNAEHCVKSNVIYGYVCDSINAECRYPDGLPTEFARYEDRINKKVQYVESLYKQLGEQDPRGTIRRTAHPYLYEMTYYGKVDYDKLEEDLEKKYYPIGGFGCSGFTVGKYHCRNYDFPYSNSVCVVVKHPAYKDQMETITIADDNPDLIKATIDSLEESDAYINLLGHTVEGINSEGLVVQTNMVTGLDTDYSARTIGTNPGKPKLCAFLVARYILDHCKTVGEIGALLAEKDIWTVTKEGELYDSEYHWLASDNYGGSVSIEIINNKVVIKPNNIITNFYLDRVRYDENGNVILSSVNKHSEGVERYNIITGHLEELGEEYDEEDLKEILEDVKFTKAYTLPCETEEEKAEYWWSDTNGRYNIEAYDYTVDISNNTDHDSLEMQAVIFAEKILYDNRDRDTALTWHTSHSVVYDKEARKLYIWNQEEYDEDPVEFEIAYPTF